MFYAIYIFRVTLFPMSYWGQKKLYGRICLSKVEFMCNGFLRTEVNILVDNKRKTHVVGLATCQDKRNNGLTLVYISNACKNFHTVYSTAIMYRKKLLFCVLVLHVASLQGNVINEKVLQLSHKTTKCTYDYEVTVYTARGAKSTLSDGYQVHALVRYSSVILLRTKSPLMHFCVCDISHEPLFFVEGIVHVFLRIYKNVGWRPRCILGKICFYAYIQTYRTCSQCIC